MPDNPQKCAFFWRGGCKNGWTCRYSHSDNVISGICRLPSCKYQNVEHYKHKCPSHWKPGICKFYETNVCAYKHMCFNIHKVKGKLVPKNKSPIIQVCKSKEYQFVNGMERIQKDVKILKNVVHKFEAKVNVLSAIPKKGISVKLKKSRTENSKSKKRKRNHFKSRKKLKSLVNKNGELKEELFQIKLSMKQMINKIEEIRNEICLQKKAENVGTKNIIPKEEGEEETIQTIKPVHQEGKEFKTSYIPTHTRNYKENEVDNSVNEGQMKNEPTDREIKEEMRDIMEDKGEEIKYENDSEEEMEEIANKHFFQPFNYFMALQGKKSTK